MLELTGEYKGYKIRVDDYDSLFCTEVGTAFLRSKSLKVLKRQIDEIHKEGFEKISAIHLVQPDRYYYGTITSVTEDDQAWFSYEKENPQVRGKVHFSEICLDTEEHREKLVKLKQIQENFRKVQKAYTHEIASIMQSIKRYQPNTKENR